MGDESAKPARRPRADALRNRERVLTAAQAVFSAGGPDASLEAVAREAGLGIGTLYRHFPTRESLFEAVYRREVDLLAALAERLSSDGTSAFAALRSWLHATIDMVATKKGMMSALAVQMHKNSTLTAYSGERLATAARLLLDRARAAGDIGTEIAPEDLLRVLFGISYTNDQPGWQEHVRRLIDIFIDGLRRPRDP